MRGTQTKPPLGAGPRDELQGPLRADGPPELRQPCHPPAFGGASVRTPLPSRPCSERRTSDRYGDSRLYRFWPPGMGHLGCLEVPGQAAGPCQQRHEVHWLQEARLTHGVLVPLIIFHTQIQRHPIILTSACTSPSSKIKDLAWQRIKNRPLKKPVLLSPSHK